MWRQFIRECMWGRVTTGSGIRGTMLRDATTTAAIVEGSIATETTFTAAAGNTKPNVRLKQTVCRETEIRNNLQSRKG
jgi:hypothetical protein